MQWQGNKLVIYTMLSILFAIKRELGLEAMLEYMEQYERVVGEGNPRLRLAVNRAMTKIDVGKIYHDTLHTKKKL